MKVLNMGFILMLTICILSLSGCVPAQMDAPQLGTIDEVGEANEPLQELMVNFFSCGKADSALLRIGEHSMLIDTGTNKSGKDILSRIKALGVSELDYMVITHMDKDHVGGADVILDGLKVNKVLVGPDSTPSKQVEQYLEAAERLNITPVRLRMGETFTFGEATVTVLGPQKDAYEQQNDLSLVLHIAYGDTAFLFTGDAEKPSIFELLHNWGADGLRADVLKVPHHGGIEDNSATFFDQVLPSIAVIPCERDTKDDLPDREVVSLLTDIGAQVFVAGDKEVYVVSDGRQVSVK